MACQTNPNRGEYRGGGRGGGGPSGPDPRCGDEPRYYPEPYPSRFGKGTPEEKASNSVVMIFETMGFYTGEVVENLYKNEKRD